MKTYNMYSVILQNANVVMVPANSSREAVRTAAEVGFINPMMAVLNKSKGKFVQIETGGYVPEKVYQEDLKEEKTS